MQAQVSDEHLVQAAVRGDSVAFGVLLERYYPMVLRVCMRLVHEPTLAEDCAQDAAIVAWLRLNQLRSADLFPSWLKGIGRHMCRHALRERGYAFSNELELDKAEVCGDELPIDFDLPQIVRGAIDDLPPGARAAVNAFYFRACGYAEAAAELGISTSALKVRLHNARQLLRYRFRLHDPPNGEAPRSPPGQVQNAYIVAAATQWPAPLKDQAAQLTADLARLSATLGAGDMNGAMTPAHDAHEGEHMLSHMAYDWLSAQAGIAPMLTGMPED